MTKGLREDEQKILKDKSFRAIEADWKKLIVRALEVRFSKYFHKPNSIHSQLETASSKQRELH